MEPTTPPKLTELRLRVLPYQAEVLGWEQAYGLVVGGRGAAKTRLAALCALKWLLQWPGIPFAVCADDFQKLRTNFFEEFNELLSEIGWHHGRELVFNESKRRYTTAWGSSLTGFTMDKPPERTKGPTVGGVIFDEADQISQEHYEIFEVCARHPRGPRQRRVFANATPPSHYLNAMYDPRHGATRPDHVVMRVPTYLNRFLPATEIRQLERRYRPGTLPYRRWVLGEPVAMQGALWPEFGPEHITAEPPGKLHVFHANGLDLGYRDPYAFLTARVDPQGRIIITGEYQQDGLSAIQHVPRLRQMWRGGPIFCDHDASERATLRDLGIETIAAQKEIAYGIELVRSLIVDGMLQVSERCPLTIEAIENSTWNPKGIREIPTHDKYSHLASALRYLCVGVHNTLLTGDRATRYAAAFNRRTLV